MRPYADYPMCETGRLGKRTKEDKIMARTKEQTLCKMTSAKAAHMLWLKYFTDVIALFGLNFLAGAGHMTEQEAGKAAMIFTAISWILWFLILYFHRNFRKRWLWEKRGRMTLPVFICCVGITLLIQYLSTALLAGIEILLNNWGIGLNGQSEYLDQISLVAVISACLIAPFFEELLFRGLIQGVLAKHVSPRVGIFVSAVLFALLHQNLEQGIFTFLFGLLLGIVAYRYSLYAAIALHAFNNTLSEVALFLTNGGKAMLLPTAILGFLIIFTMVTAIVICIKRRSKIGAILREGKGAISWLNCLRSKRFIAVSILLIVGMLGDFVRI